MDIVSVNQGIVPIINQEPSRKIAEENVRLLNCWLGIRPPERLGEKFCEDCIFVEQCLMLYTWFAGAREMLPMYLAQRIFRLYDIDSEYYPRAKRRGR